MGAAHYKAVLAQGNDGSIEGYNTQALSAQNSKGYTSGLMDNDSMYRTGLFAGLSTLGRDLANGVSTTQPFYASKGLSSKPLERADRMPLLHQSYR